MPRPNIGRRLTSIRLDPDLLDLLDADAGDDSSRSDVLREILRAHYGKAAA